MDDGNREMAAEGVFYKAFQKRDYFENICFTINAISEPTHTPKVVTIHVLLMKNIKIKNRIESISKRVM